MYICILPTFRLDALVLRAKLQRTRASSQNVGKISSYQVKLSRKRTFHLFMSTGATEKSLHPMTGLVTRLTFPPYLRWCFQTTLWGWSTRLDVRWSSCLWMPWSWWTALATPSRCPWLRSGARHSELLRHCGWEDFFHIQWWANFEVFMQMIWKPVGQGNISVMWTDIVFWWLILCRVYWGGGEGEEIDPPSMSCFLLKLADCYNVDSLEILLLCPTFCLSLSWFLG